MIKPIAFVAIVLAGAGALAYFWPSSHGSCVDPESGGQVKIGENLGTWTCTDMGWMMTASGNPFPAEGKQEQP